MDGHDRCSRAQIGVSDKGIELSSRLDKAGMDSSEPLGLLRGVAVPVAQGALLGLGGAVSVVVPNGRNQSNARDPLRTSSRDPRGVL